MQQKFLRSHHSFAQNILSHGVKVLTLAFTHFLLLTCLLHSSNKKVHLLIKSRKRHFLFLKQEGTLFRQGLHIICSSIGRFFSEICTPLPSPSGLLKCHPLKMSISDQSIKTAPLLQDTYFFSGLLSVFLQRNINYKEERPLFYALLYPQSRTVACTIC